MKYVVASLSYLTLLHGCYESRGNIILFSVLNQCYSHDYKALEIFSYVNVTDFTR